MQATLIEMEPTVDAAWLRAAIRECITYGEHAENVEVVDGKVVCWNCGGHV